MTTSFIERLEGKKPKPPRAVTEPYAQVALDDECDTLASTPEGQRNDQLNRAAFNIGQLIGGGGLDENQAVSSLRDAARRAGLDDTEIDRTIASGIESGKQQPRSSKQSVEIPLRATSIRVLTRGDLRNLPDPVPLIDNTLDQGTIAHLYGRWGTGKSFVALDWGACVATGKTWQGRPVQRAKVLYVAAEGATGYRDRIDAWETGWSTTVEDEWMHWVPDPVNLTKSSDVEALCELIRSAGYGFVILDTLARCAVGADENSAKDMGIVIDSMNQLRHATPGGHGVILDAHHSGKDGKTSRGSSAIEAGVDTVYFIESDGAGFTLSREKRKDGPRADQLSLRLDPIGSSCVVSQGGETQAGENLLRLIMSQLYVSTGVSAGELQRVAVEEYKMSRATYQRKRAELVECGQMVNTGTRQRPFYEWREPVGVDV